MNCEFVKTHIQEYLDGSLVALDRNAFVRHVDDCPSCEAEVVAFRDVFAGLRRLRRERAPVGIQSAVLAHLREQGLVREQKVPLVVKVVERFMELPGVARYPLAAMLVVAALYFPLAAVLGLARGFAVSFTDFATEAYQLAAGALRSVSLFERIFDNVASYAKAVVAVSRAVVSVIPGENVWLLGVAAASLLTTVLIVSIVSRRKRSADHAHKLF